MTPRLADLVLAAALSVFAFPALAQSAAPATDDLAPSRDSPRATSAGTTFTAPAGWSMRMAPNMVVLNSPEGDSHIAIVDVEAPDAGAATATAWKTYRADAKWPLKVSAKQAPRNGWTERHLQ